MPDLTSVEGVQVRHLKAWFEMGPLDAFDGPDGVVWLDQVRDEHCCDVLFLSSSRRGSGEVAAAAVVGGFVAIWEEGRDLERVALWEERADGLLADPAADLSPIAKAAVFLHAFTSRWMWRAEASLMQSRLPMLRQTVDVAGSDALRVLAASTEAYVQIMCGELHAARQCLLDAAYFAPAPEDALIPKLHLEACRALVDAFAGEPAPAVQRLTGLLGQPGLPMWPLHQRLTLLGHFAMCLAQSGRFNEAERVAADLRQIAVPGNRAYQRSYLHYALGTAALMSGRAGEALAHARMAVDLGTLSGSVAAELIPALLVIQACIDLGREEEAVDQLERCEPLWRERGMRLQSAAASCERAALCVRRQDLPGARQAWAAAQRTLPVGEPMPHLHRSARFFERLNSDLLGDPSAVSIDAESPSLRRHFPVQVRMLGGFEVSVDGRSIQEVQWKGARTKTLLKLIVALGGQQVSVERLADALWPDADGAKARSNLKVVLWRLRRLGIPEGTEPHPWLTLAHGQVSIDPVLCDVDSLRLLHAAGLPLDDWAACAACLRGQAGDFLPNDDALPFVVDARDRIRRVYADTAQRAARLLSATLPAEDEATLETIGWLQQALVFRPHNEHCAQWLMILLLRQGRQAEALAVFAEIRERLTRDLGLASPGAALCALRDEAQAVRPGPGT